jgi:hypothetical protein
MSIASIFESISKKVKNKDLTKKQKTEFVSNVETFNGDEISTLYAIITMYKRQCDVDLGQDTTLHSHPYNGCSDNSSGVVFDLDDFPTKLKHILYKFMNIVISKNIDELQLWKSAIQNN